MSSQYLQEFFKYDIVMGLLIANHSLPHILGEVILLAQELAASIDILYSRVSDQHLHRIISAIVYVKVALKRASIIGQGGGGGRERGRGTPRHPTESY